MFTETINQYIETNKEIDALFYTVGLEADSTVANSSSDLDTDKNKMDSSNTFFERFKVIIEKFLAMIQRTLVTLRHMYEKVLLTDKGFKKELREAEVNRKPLNGIKLITYSYTPELLDGVNVKFKKVVTDLINKVILKPTEDESSPLLFDKTEFTKFIFKQIGAPENVDDMNIYFKYLREKFRGQKSEKTIMSSSIPQHIKAVEGYEKVHLASNRDLAVFKTRINELNSSLKVTSKSPNIADEEKRKLVRKIQNLLYLYNMYSSFCSIYMELHVEHMLNSRVILRRLYQL